MTQKTYTSHLGYLYRWEGDQLMIANNADAHWFPVSVNAHDMLGILMLREEERESTR